MKPTMNILWFVCYVEIPTVADHHKVKGFIFHSLASSKTGIKLNQYIPFRLHSQLMPIIPEGCSMRY